MKAVSKFVKEYWNGMQSSFGNVCVKGFTHRIKSAGRVLGNGANVEAARTGTSRSNGNPRRAKVDITGDTQILIYNTI